MVYFLTFFPPENSNVFKKVGPFLYGACWSAGRWWLVDGMCSLRLCVAGVVPLCTFICNNSSLKKREVFPFFLLFLSDPFVYFSLIWYRIIGRNGRRYQRVLALCAPLTGVVLNGLTLRRFVFDFCVCMFYLVFAWGLVLWTDLTRGLWVGGVLKCKFAYDKVWLSWGDPVRLTGR